MERRSEVKEEMSWDGNDRRKDDRQHKENCQRLDAIESAIKTSNDDQKNWMSRHDEIILGDGDTKPGLSGKITMLRNDFIEHTKADRIWFGAILSVVGIILAAVLKK